MGKIPPANRDRIQERLDELSVKIDEEMEEWRREQIHPNMIPVNFWLQDCAIGALSKYVVEKLGGDQRELDLTFKEIYLERTQAQREAILKARSRSQIINPNGLPFESN